MSKRRIRTFSNDDEDEYVDEGPQNVGHGCADFTPDEDARGTLTHAVKMMLKLRKSGVMYVKFGDIEASWVDPTQVNGEGDG